jgi:hypothetical protein
MVKCDVFFAVRAEFLHNIQTGSGFKGLSPAPYVRKVSRGTFKPLNYTVIYTSICVRYTLCYFLLIYCQENCHRTKSVLIIHAAKTGLEL